MSNITIVTSFFDIGRNESNIEGMSRNNETYLRYFKFWARIKNPLIIYTQPNLKDKVMQIRKEFGLEDRTRIVIIDNIYNILPEYYDRMKLIEQNRCFLDFRYFDKAMSNSAKYCYLVLLQYWFLKDAVERGWVDDYVAWLDFGFNHGGKYYTNPEDFEFLWDYDFEPKINCFSLYNPDNISCIDSLQFQKDCFMGGMMAMPNDYAMILWRYIIEAENALFMLGCMDDDQQLLLMAYKEHTQDFFVRYCDWFEPIKISGASQLRSKNGVGETKQKFTWLISRMLNKFSKLFCVMLQKTPTQRFIKRCKKRCKLMYD